MNTTLTPMTRHSWTSEDLTEFRPTRRVGPIDRAALHLGLALIRWGRRPPRGLAREERLARAYERGLALRAYEVRRIELDTIRARVRGRHP
ncbi:MAG: hypothetical protein QM675_08205 [Protaetiibacter sp.]